jgi:hypothetical protein
VSWRESAINFCGSFSWDTLSTSSGMRGSTGSAIAHLVCHRWLEKQLAILRLQHSAFNPCTSSH